MTTIEEMKPDAKRLLDAARDIQRLRNFADIARFLEESEQTLSNWKKRGVPKGKTVAICKRIGCRPEWLETGLLPMTEGPLNLGPHVAPVAIPPGDSRLPIRRALFKLSAGVSGYEVEYENGESEPIFMAKRWFDHNHYNPERLIALKVNGRSMEPKMHDGDLVIVNMDSHTPKDGVVFAVNYEGEMVIKRMKRDAGQWFISSDNQDKVRYGDKVCAEACFVLGEVVYLQTETI